MLTTRSFVPSSPSAEARRARVLASRMITWVSIERARQVDWDLFAAARWALDLSHLRHVGGYRDADAAS